MKNIEKIDRDTWLPVPLNSTRIAQEIKKYQKKRAGVVDQYHSMIEELFLLRNPQYRFNKNYQDHYKQFRAEHFSQKEEIHAGNWFYYPWLNQTIHFLPDKMHQELRTSRNKFLVSEQEQQKYYNSAIGIMGMSVGSHVALTIAMTGGAKHIKLADPDEISGSNLNRIRTGFQNIGLKKTYAVARQIYEINPYAKVTIFEEGVTEKNLGRFVDGLDLIVEEMDNPFLKIQTRFVARKLGIPMIMAADNGDNIIVDIERYDLNKKLPILHGILGNITPEQLRHVTPADLPRTIAKMAGANIATIRMLESVVQVGKTIYSWPQLGNAATLCGSVLAYLAKNIVVGNNFKSGRYEVNLDSIFVPSFKKDSKITEKHRKKFLKAMGLV